MGRQASQDPGTEEHAAAPGARHARREAPCAIPAGHPDPFLPPLESAPLLGTAGHSASADELHEDTSFINLISLAPTADKIARKRLVARVILVVVIAAVPLIIFGLIAS